MSVPSLTLLCAGTYRLGRLCAFVVVAPDPPDERWIEVYARLTRACAAATWANVGRMNGKDVFRIDAGIPGETYEIRAGVGTEYGPSLVVTLPAEPAAEAPAHADRTREELASDLDLARERIAELEHERSEIAATIGFEPGEKTLVQAVKDEWHDYMMVARHCAVIYCAASGDRISKPNTFPEEVISEMEQRESDEINEAVEEATAELRKEMAELTAHAAALKAILVRTGEPYIHDEDCDAIRCDVAGENDPVHGSHGECCPCSCGAWTILSEPSPVPEAIRAAVGSLKALRDFCEMATKGEPSSSLASFVELATAALDAPALAMFRGDA